MKTSNEIVLNNPLSCIFSVCILSCVFYSVSESSRVLATFIASAFFVLLYFYYDYFILIIMFLFFLLFNININSFYNYKLDHSSKIRIVEINSYSCMGEVDGRKIILDIDTTNIKTGDRVIISGNFKRDVDIAEGVIGNINVENFKILKKDIIYKMYRIKEKLYKEISIKIGERKAAFITSVAFGDKKNLDEDDKNIMKEMGISHVMAVSGLHMAVVYTFLSKLIRDKLSLIILLLYVIFIGASPSTCRAYTMILIMNLGKLFNRPYNSLASLSLAGIIILFIKPYEIFSLGFMLSFAATFGIITFRKSIDRGLYKLPNLIRGSIATSLSAEIFIFPILIFYFNEISFNFIIGNMLIVPIINALIVIGNLLLIFINFREIFNFLLFISHNIILLIDNILDRIDLVKIDIIFINKNVVYFYIAIMITYYFYKKGFKRSIYFPIIVFLYVIVLNYNPIPMIKYHKDGAIVVSYKGNNIAIQTKKSLDNEKLMSVAMTDKIYKNFNYIRLSENIFIKKQGENYLMAIGENKYLLLVNYEKYIGDYDIINFREEDIQEVIILNNKIIKL